MSAISGKPFFVLILRRRESAVSKDRAAHASGRPLRGLLSMRPSMTNGSLDA